MRLDFGRRFPRGNAMACVGAQKLGAYGVETQAQEALGAYIEALESYSEAEASRKFPVLAEHLKRCKACQSSLEGTRTLLRRAEQTGLIAPLTLNKDE